MAEIFRIARKDSSLAIRFSEKPWRPDTQWNDDIPFQDQKGIYVFCGECDDVSAEESDAEVWNIGKANSLSKRPISARVFDHFGQIKYDPVTGQRLPHTGHDWRDTKNVPDEIKTAIENRKCVVYTAAVSGNPKDIPDDLEKFLLDTIYLFYQVTDGLGRLPPLNTMRP